MTAQVQRIIKIDKLIDLANKLINTYKSDLINYNNPDQKYAALRRVNSIDSLLDNISRLTRIKERLVSWCG